MYATVRMKPNLRLLLELYASNLALGQTVILVNPDSPDKEIDRILKEIEKEVQERTPVLEKYSYLDPLDVVQKKAEMELFLQSLFAEKEHVVKRPWSAGRQVSRKSLLRSSSGRVKRKL